MLNVWYRPYIEHLGTGLTKPTFEENRKGASVLSYITSL